MTRPVGGKLSGDPGTGIEAKRVSSLFRVILVNILEGCASEISVLGVLNCTGLLQ